MKRILLFTILMLNTGIISAQTKAEIEVANATEVLRKAMVAGDSSQLARIVSDKLIYGHSAGHTDNKSEFVKKIVSGKSKFVSINIPDQNISLSRNTGIVHQKFDAVTADNGKRGEVHLLVLLVWQKQHHHWILMATQALHPS